MNSRERFVAALAGREVDRPPVAHVAAMTTVELQEATGCRMPEVHLDASQQATLLAANHDVLGFDAVSFIINFFGEPAALGVEMDWGAADRLPVFMSHPWQEPDDVTIPQDLLDRPPISTYLETVRIARRDHGDRMAVLGKVMGPLSMTQVMLGIERTMMGLIDMPEKIAAFLDICTDVLVRCANAQFEQGIDALAIGEGGAGAQMLSPALYERILLPVHRRMIARIDGPTIMHICGDVLSRLDLLGQTGMTCFNFDWAISPESMVGAAKDTFTVMGNINTADLLNAAPDEIARQTRDNLDAGVHIISPGCAVSPKCPNANLREMADAVAENSE